MLCIFKLSRHESGAVEVRIRRDTTYVIRMIGMCHIDVEVGFRAEIHRHDHLVYFSCPSGAESDLEIGNAGYFVFHRLHVGNLLLFSLVANTILVDTHKKFPHIVIKKGTTFSSVQK